MNYDLSADIEYPENPDPDKVRECEEFREMITTCRLTIEVQRDKPNTAVRRACRIMLGRFKGKRTRLILQKVIESAMPAAKIQTYMRQLEWDDAKQRQQDE